MMGSGISLADKKYQIVTLDFETYYAKDYTLSGKANMSEYIRDDRFHAHGVGIKINDGKTKWYTGKNIALALNQINWKKSALLAHNTPFDGFILTQVYGHTPAFYLDTLAMARACHGHHTRHDLDTIAKLHGFEGKVKRSALADTKGKQQLTKQEERALGGYCTNDVDDTYGIFWKLHPHMPDEELQLVSMTTRMFVEPVLEVDLTRVQEELNKEVGAKAAALMISGASVEDLMSNDKFANLLLTLGTHVPKKLSPSTGKMTWAFAKSDLDFQRLLNNPDPRVSRLAEARVRIKSTIGETRAVRFIEAGKDGMKLPVALNYAGAHTLRWSGGNKMNLQNLLRGGELRRSILAPKGYSIVVADSAQIEARVLAWLAGQLDIVNAFRKGEDVYKLMASVIYCVPIDQVTKDQRFIGKVCVLGLGFGMGHVKLRDTLAKGALGGPKVEMSEAECVTIVNIYRSKNAYIKQLWKIMDRLITSMLMGRRDRHGPLVTGKGFVQLPNSLFLQYYGLHGEAQVIYDSIQTTEVTYLTRRGRSKLYGGLLTENVVQALARCIIAEQMLAIDKKYRVVTMSHDEIVVICPTSEADKCLEFMVGVMRTSPAWCSDLPLDAEGGHDLCYSK